MKNTTWVLLLLGLLVAIAAVLVMVHYYQDNSPVPPELLRDADRPKPQQPEVTDQDITRWQADLNAAGSDTRLEAILVLNDLAESQPQRLGPVLIEALANEDAQVRSSAAMGLGDINYAPAAPKLVELLDDGSKDVRLYAGQSLVKLDQDGLRAVMQALADNSIVNTDAALDVARRITGQSFGLGSAGRQAALRFWAQYEPTAP